MFPKMRRSKQQLSQAQCEELLAAGTAGVLSLPGADGYPYGVPLSYAYRDGRFYFHSAVRGHKLEAVGTGCKASFCVIGADQIVPEERTTYFRSVIAFGTVRPLSDPAEKRAAIGLLCEKYCAAFPEENAREIGESFERFCMLELSVEHMTGKEAIELIRRHDGT